ncbi:hypothetical protein PoB_003251500 [Plakobranchus ocellatus]|uniref:Uncharacterized protein n=1 Tax=Plakobranchus ocellatus TaxID=259542 RepID=A0AAV4ACX0_9GAST|nr:hypothetical protein PoB_003251500 [Plakobranchus ocellatus]
MGQVSGGGGGGGCRGGGPGGVGGGGGGGCRGGGPGGGGGGGCLAIYICVTANDRVPIKVICIGTGF